MTDKTFSDIVKANGTHLIKIEGSWFCIENTLLSTALKYGLQSAGSLIDGEYFIAKLGPMTSTEELGEALEAYRAGRIPEIMRLKGLAMTDMVYANANMLHVVSCSMLEVSSIEDVYALQEKQFGKPTDPNVIAARDAATEARKKLEEALAENQNAMTARSAAGYASGLKLRDTPAAPQESHEL